MTRLVAVAAMALGLAFGPAQARADREAQWSFALERVGGADVPTATFRDWTFRTVVFHVACDRRRHELRLTYFGDGAVPLKPSDGLSIYGGSTFTLRTRLIDGRLEGRLRLSPRVRAVLARPGDLQFVAPNEMGEPWYVGEAKAFKRVVTACV